MAEVDFRFGTGKPQVSFDLPLFHKWMFPDGTPWTYFYRKGEGYLLRFPGLGDFDVSADGLFIQAWPVPGVSEETIQHLYLNQVLPLALSKQGKWIFHAGAIDTPFGAVAFLGESGRGKSTLAASFAMSGYRFFTDDALLLEKLEDVYLVQPSHPSIRLWRDSQEALVGDDVQLAPPVQYTSKARLLSGGELGFCPESRTLRRMYFLGDGSSTDVCIERMTPSEAVMGLVKNSFLLDIEAPDAVASHFNRLADMAELQIYYRLDYPRSYDMLPAVRQAIIEHAAAEDA